MASQHELQPYVRDMGNDVWLIDLMEQDLPGRTSAYLILDEQPTLIETGSANSHQTLVRAIQSLGIEPGDLKYVVVTHVHLDHAGGAGQMMQIAPDAKLVVHPRGAKHMKDPSRLWDGARSVYGAELERLFGAVVPVPESQILVRDHGETLNIGKRTLTFFDSPGHAKHHFTVLDPVSDCLYAGDAVGLRYASRFTGWDFEWVMPSTSPVDFDPDAVQRTMRMLEDVPFSFVYHAHFGKTRKEEAMAETLRGAQAMADLVERTYRPDIPLPEMIDALRTWFRKDLTAQGHQVPEDLSVLDIDMVLDAMGLLHYEQRRRQQMH